jgi:hypothetical protein
MYTSEFLQANTRFRFVGLFLAVAPISICNGKSALWQGFPCATGPIQAATVSPQQKQATITHAQLLSPGNFRKQTKRDLDYQLNGVPTATFQRVRGIPLLEVTPRTTFPGLSDNQGMVL